MLTSLRNRAQQHNPTAALVAAAVLALAFLLGQRASTTWLGLLIAGLGAPVLLIWPALGLPALVVAALAVPIEFGTGTDVRLNPATLLVPALTGVWLLSMVARGRVQFMSSRANRPLLIFLLAGLLSLLIGIATWDPTVPRSGNFLLVQLAQWAIFAFSALAFWLTAHLAAGERWLRRLTATFLLVGGGLAILRMIPGLGGLVAPLTTAAFIRAPFWVLLAGVAAGQLLWNRGLPLPARLYLALLLAVALFYAFVDQREAASNWVGIAATLGTLFWLRFPRLRWPVAIVILVLVVLGMLFPYLYEFAGGDAEWEESGASRLLLIGRVVEVTMRNPITGLGPAAYRPYANMKPLAYGRAYWVMPQINSHNNYVDLFAHGGLLGLALFGWFVFEMARLGHRLHRRYRHGFTAAYVNGIAAAGVGSLVIMALADWILPFVYNIGFHGFQASVLMWLFLGGLVALDNMSDSMPPASPTNESATAGS